MPETRDRTTAPDSELLFHLASTVGAPGFALPWLDRFYEPADIDLVFSAAAGELPGDHPPRTLDRAVRRAVLDRDDGIVTPASFHARYEMWAFYEHWADIPQEMRDLLNEWELDDYLDEVGAGISAIRDSKGRSEGDQHDYSFLLLEEAEELLRTRPAIYLWPCNCRAMMGKCEKSHTVCLRFDNERDIGWEITPERAIQILRQADREGLMRTAYLSSMHGHHGICSCCSCCCFPILVGEKLHAAHLWPVRRHLAIVDAEACTACGRCVKRCPFAALSIDRQGAPALRLDATACRGCGLCATGCSEDAIRMQSQLTG